MKTTRISPPADPATYAEKCAYWAARYAVRYGHGEWFWGLKIERLPGPTEDHPEAARPDITAHLFEPLGLETFDAIPIGVAFSFRPDVVETSQLDMERAAVLASGWLLPSAFTSYRVGFPKLDYRPVIWWKCGRRSFRGAPDPVCREFSWPDFLPDAPRVPVFPALFTPTRPQAAGPVQSELFA